MTKQEKLIVTAYTGYLMTNYDDYHEFVEKLLGRPVYTHEFADEKVISEIQALVKEDFLKICRE